MLFVLISNGYPSILDTIQDLGVDIYANLAVTDTACRILDQGDVSRWPNKTMARHQHDR